MPSTADTPTPSATAGARPLVIAGLSVRAAAEAARRDGWSVIGLDAYGDADTRAACAHWQPIALDPQRPWLLDPASLDAALHALPRDHPGQPRGGAQGSAATWLVLTGGFDAEGAALAPWLARWEHAFGLQLAGSAPADLAGLRDPRRFFAHLDALEIPHPPVAFSPPSRATGWLRKDFGASGGWHVQWADRADALSASAQAGQGGRLYWQHELAGASLSLTLLGNGKRAAVLGLNRQLLAPEPGSPFRFGGVIGPCPATAAESARWAGWADRLVAAFGLRGLVSMDLLRDDARSWLLEVNPRPSASLGLYGPAGGLMRAHLAACDGHLPDAATLAHLRGQGERGQGVRGHAIAYCPTALDLDTPRWRALHRHAVRLGLHDLPAAPLALAAGDPLCSLSAQGRDADDVAHRLAQQRRALAALLASEPAPSSTTAPAAVPVSP